MPTLTAAQITLCQTAQDRLKTAEAKLDIAANAVQDVMDALYAVMSVDATIAANAAFALKGSLIEARGILDQAHGQVSTALLAYDPINGMLIIQGPPGGGGGGRN